MGALLGMAVGGFIGIAILSAIIERIAFKERGSTQRAELTVGTALILAAVLAGFGMADGGPFVWSAGFIYLPGAVIVFLWYRKRYSDAWTEDEEPVPE
jgi:Ca2+/Na+ antiporter